MDMLDYKAQVVQRLILHPEFAGRLVGNSEYGSDRTFRICYLQNPKKLKHCTSLFEIDGVRYSNLDFTLVGISRHAPIIELPEISLRGQVL